MNDSMMRNTLIDVLTPLGPLAGSIQLGGGYGLYLKQQHLIVSGGGSLIDLGICPPPRATHDLDLLVGMELISNAEHFGKIRSTLDSLGFTVVQGAEHYQFARSATARGAGEAEGFPVKVDLLTAQKSFLNQQPGIHVDDRRARPTASPRPRLHAHPTDGVLPIKAESFVVYITSVGLARVNDSAHRTTIHIPHTLSYLLMKLTAWRDRRDDQSKDLGRHHALDLYRIVAMTTPMEEAAIPGLLAPWMEDDQVRSCRRIVAEDFSTLDARGIDSLRAHADWTATPAAAASLTVFMEALLAYMPPL